MPSVPAIQPLLRTVSIWFLVAAFSACLACPFCLAPSQTWAEMYASADVVIWGRLISSHPGNDRKAPSSVVEVIKVAKGGSHAAVKQKIQLALPIFAKVDSTVLLKGSFQETNIAGMSDTFATDSNGKVLDDPQVKQGHGSSGLKIIPASTSKVISAGDSTESHLSLDSQNFVWDFAEPVSAEAFQYITTSPDLEKPSADRLLFFLKHLQHKDELIAADAWAEFANSKYEEIVAIKKSLPADQLKQWIMNVESSPERAGLYGMMLGLCGRQQDVPFLLKQIGPGAQSDVRFGVEGLMGGLLVLAKDEGLDFLVRSRLGNPNATTSEVFNAMSAVKYAWEYEPDLFSKDVLRASLRPLLKREEFQEIIITDLARWEDWSVMAELVELSATTDQAGVIRSTIGYCWQAEKATTATDEQKQQATSLLAAIKEAHPAAYRRQLMFR